MKIEVKQSERPHDANQLHDEMIEAGLHPDPVMVHDDRTEFTFATKADAEKAKGLIAAHAKKDKPKPPDRAALKAKVREAKTVAELRDAILELL